MPHPTIFDNWLSVPSNIAGRIFQADITRNNRCASVVGTKSLPATKSLIFG